MYWYFYYLCGPRAGSFAVPLVRRAPASMGLSSLVLAINRMQDKIDQKRELGCRGHPHKACLAAIFGAI